MKIREIITETATESRELQTVAKKIADYIVDRGGKPRRFTAQDLGIGGREAAVARTLRQISFSVVDRPGDTVVAEYDPNTLQIEINWSGVENDAEERGTSPAAEMTRTLVHELQHAVDDVKSSGRALNKTAGQRATDTEQYDEYLALPQEINARFAEALGQINQQIPYIREPSQLHGIINHAFAGTDINRVFPGKTGDRRYRRLLSRAYAFYDSVINGAAEPTVDTAADYILKNVG